jgi:succinate dehydrogenase flavin-adding protein (antitoxin of CptAB toxin-antitoxin module)
LKDEFKNFCDEIFRYVTDMRRKLLSDLKESSKNSFTEFHEKNANDLWEIAMDYRNAHKAEWGKLKVLKINDLRNISTEDLKRESNSKARAAYKQYRAACKIADSKNLISYQIKFRRFMALCLYISDQYLEAQLYALSAINLVYRNSNKPLAKQELNEAKRTFDKVKGGNVSDLKNPNQQSTGRTVNLSSDPYALVAIDRELSYFEMKNLNHSINEDLEKITTELMLKADRKLFKWKSNPEAILMAERHATGVAAGGALTVGSACTIAQSLITGSMAVGGSFSCFTGVGVIFMGLYIGKQFWNKGTELMQKPETRKTLNEIMRKALIAYDNGDYNKFLEELSEEYRNGKKILTIQENGEVNAERIIKDLLKHNFRSDGIAYLLNLLGEVLLSGKVTIQGMTDDDLKNLGSIAFKGVMSKKLEDEAKALDECIEVYRNSGYRNIELSMKEYARDFENEEQRRPFFYRLEEIRNITRINLAMQYILNGKPDAMKQAKVIIQQVRESLITQSSSIAKRRLKVLDDFLWVISGDTSIKENAY